MGVLARLTKLFRNKVPDYNQIVRRDFQIATRNPWFREKLKEVSIQQDEEGSYYTGMLNIVADHTIGPYPSILGDHPSNQVCDELEDRWSGWCENNQIGTALRQIRRGAARTGLGIGIPYTKRDSLDKVSLAVKTICSTELMNPSGASFKDRIYEGIEYDENWDIKRLYFKDGSSYAAKDILIWYKQNAEGLFYHVPECAPALCLFPSIKRFMDAIVKGTEFKASIPMAIELDPLIYKPEDASNIPTGAFKYEPNMVPTLPPGTKLAGINVSGSATEDTAFIKLVVGAGARCFTMPVNLALGNSSDSNMASSQVDYLPWEVKITIDRTDFNPLVRKLLQRWLDMAQLVEGYLSPATKSQLDTFKYSINYPNVFRHPDPLKNANAKLVDMVSGNSTLYRINTNNGMNPRREREREAKLLGITVEELNQHYLAGRTNLTLQILKGDTNEPQTAEEQQAE